MRVAFVSLCVACFSTNALADPIQLEDFWLDTIVAGQPATGVEVTAQVIDGDNFAWSSAVFSQQDPTTSASASCTDPCGGGTLAFGSVVSGGLNGSEPVDLIFAMLQSPGVIYGAGALVDTDSGSSGAAAVGPNGTAGANIKGVTLVQNDLVSATVAYGRGKTTGNGEVGINGVVLDGRGVGNGFAIETPRGDVLLFGIAVAVDPSALVPNI